MIHEHYSIDIGYDDDRDVVAWSEITLSGRPLAECEQFDRELLQRGLEHNAFVELLVQPKHTLADIEKKASPPNEYYDALRSNDTEREEAAKQYVDSQVNIGTQGMCRLEGFLVGAQYADSHPSDETIMRILNCIGYEERSWIEFVRKELEKRKDDTKRQEAI